MQKPKKRVAIVVQPTRPYCRRVLRGITAVGAQAQWEYLLLPLEARPTLASLTGGYLNGVIGHFADRDAARAVAKEGIPVVDISGVRGGIGLPCVVSDDIAVGRLAAAHLLSLGLPHFGFFGSAAHYFSLLRQQGFAQAISGAGLNCHAFVDGRAKQTSGERANARLETWLQQLPKPIGILAADDARALQLLAACRKLAIPVPQSVAVVGVDNDEVFCDLADPPLSSVALATQRIGYEAGRMLDRLMAGATVANDCLLIPPATVVPRRSSDLPAVIDPDVAAAVRYIVLHVRDQLRVADVLREVAISRSTLDRRFRKLLRRTPAAEIRNAQIAEARHLLEDTDESMEKIAIAAGFSNSKQFGNTFRRITGVTPTAYRRRARRGQAS
jgi:LacI family transcriptional regulator